jgi:tetratricopeptide (TPR) repeat protein
MAMLRAQQPGRQDEAWTLFERALALKEQAGDPREQGVTLHEMAMLRAQQNRLDEALTLFQRSMKVDGTAEARVANLLGMAELANLRGDENEAKRLLGQAEAEIVGQTASPPKPDSPPAPSS